MKTLIAIGGGSFQKQETKDIDQYALHRCQSEVPHVLLIPAASHDDQGYAKRFKHYFRGLHAQVEVLRLYHTKLSKQNVQNKIREADMLYLGAGSSRDLMEQLTKWELIDVIKEAYAQGCVILGVSAGANACFSYGYSDQKEGFSFVAGMELEEGIFCPHAQKEERQGFFKEASPYHKELYACEDGYAWVWEDGTMTKRHI